MAHLITGSNILDAWKKALEFLLKNGKQYSNLILSINNPNAIENSWLNIHDPKKIIGKLKSIKDVANTIFPQRLKEKYATRNEMFQRYKALHNRRKKPGVWGTYFFRLISFGKDNVNQLERVISKINNWQKMDYKAAFVFHLSSPETDSPRKIGGPCWHYGELSLKGGKIDFLVVYRSQDYFGKALGNFIGLSRLLTFICEETGMEPGIMTCHSVWAFLDSNNKNTLRLLQGL